MTSGVRTVATALLVIGMTFTGSAYAAPQHTSAPLSVMTYNVRGLPWPIAWGRNAAFDAMVDQLRAMRRRGRQPHIVLLQEAFTPEAKRIGVRSGYRYVAYGPTRNDRTPFRQTAVDRKFAAGARILRGERSGKILDSGLQILSDYPILAVRTQAFPDFACAGFDCLANKGVLMALVAVPGSSTPVVVSTAHFNSRRSSHVSDARSNYAYRRQWDSATAFLAQSDWHQYPMVFAGDFNVGKSMARRKAFRVIAAGLWKADRKGQIRDVLRSCYRSCQSFPVAAREALFRAKDWQLFASTKSASLVAEHIAVPFGRAADGTMLSDHIGYAATYRLRGNSLLRLAQSDSVKLHYMRAK